MKFLVVVAAVVACTGARSINSGWVLPAGNIGTSGILRKDGSTDLFSHDFAHEIVAIGPAGIVLKNGPPVQLDANLNMVGRSKRSSGAGYVLPAGNIGRSGIVRKDGTVDLFAFDFAHDIAEVGPSGIVLKSGQPIQLDENLRMVGRSKRSSGAGYVLPAGNIGRSGILRKDGSVELFDFDFAHDIAEVGPSGIVLKSGQPIQLDENLRMVGRSKRSSGAGYVLPAGNIGRSGILRKDGSVELFDFDFAHDIAEVGPSGIVLKSGQPIQLDENLRMVGRSKRSSGAGYVLPAGNIGRSGILRKDGSVELFDFDFAHDIAEVGPSGIVLKSGQPIQLDENLRMVGRSKRHIMNDSGMLTSWGQAIVFREPFTTIVHEGPSGIVLSDGQLIQKPAQ